jgi:hypothetical protein
MPSPPPIVGYAAPASPGADAPPAYASLCAAGSWLLPIAVCLFSPVFLLIARRNRFAELVGSFAMLGVVAGGLAMGAVAMFLSRRYQKRGLLGAGLIGAVLNAAMLSLMLFGGVRAYMQARQLASTGLTPILAATTKKHFDDAMLRGSEWYGHVDIDGARVSVHVFPDQSPFSIDVGRNFTRPFSLALIYVDATKSSHNIAVEISPIDIQMGDGQVIHAVDTHQVIQTAQSYKTIWQQDYDRPVSVPAHNVLRRHQPVFLPSGTDPSKINRATLIIDGHPFLVSGRFYAAAERARIASTRLSNLPLTTLPSH